jgi:hypothetical protein
MKIPLHCRSLNMYVFLISGVCRSGQCGSVLQLLQFWSCCAVLPLEGIATHELPELCDEHEMS